MCIQISQEAGKVVWYSDLFKNFPQFVVIHTVKGFRTEAPVLRTRPYSMYHFWGGALRGNTGVSWFLFPCPDDYKMR